MDNPLGHFVRLTYACLSKTECIRTMVFHDGPYKTVADIELATAGWVDLRQRAQAPRVAWHVDPRGVREGPHYAADNREPHPV